MLLPGDLGLLPEEGLVMPQCSMWSMFRYRPCRLASSLPNQSEPTMTDPRGALGVFEFKPYRKIGPSMHPTEWKNIPNID